MHVIMVASGVAVCMLSHMAAASRLVLAHVGCKMLSSACRCLLWPLLVLISTLNEGGLWWRGGSLGGGGVGLVPCWSIVFTCMVAILLACMAGMAAGMGTTQLTCALLCGTCTGKCF